MWSFGSDCAACEGVLKLIVDPSNKSDEVSLKKTHYGLRIEISFLRSAEQNFTPMQRLGTKFVRCNILALFMQHQVSFVQIHQYTSHLCQTTLHTVPHPCVEPLHSRGYERQHFCDYDRLWQVQHRLHSGWYQLFHLETRDGFISTVQGTLQVHH